MGQDCPDWGLGKAMKYFVEGLPKKQLKEDNLGMGKGRVLAQPVYRHGLADRSTQYNPHNIHRSNRLLTKKSSSRQL